MFFLFMNIHLIECIEFIKEIFRDIITNRIIIEMMYHLIDNSFIITFKINTKIQPSEAVLSGEVNYIPGQIKSANNYDYK